MTNNYAQQSFCYLLIFFLCKKSFTEVHQVNPIINARLYICSNLLPFSTNTSVSWLYSKYLNMCHFKRKKGGIYCSQDKWESTSL